MLGLSETAAEPPSASDWSRVLETLAVSPMVRQYLRHGQALRCEPEAVDLAVEPGYLPLLSKAETRLAVQQALAKHLGREPRLTIVPLTQETGVGSLAREEREQAASRQAAAEARVAADPRINTFLEVLDARLECVEIAAPVAAGALPVGRAASIEGGDGK